MAIAEIIETYYGEGEIRGDQTYLVCLIEPHWRSGTPSKHWLIMDFVVPVEGSMVVRTVRYAQFREDGTYPSFGRPTKAVDISYDPDPHPPGLWRGRAQGSWPVKLARIRRPSVWERLRKL